jgi:hypothetical protein
MELYGNWDVKYDVRPGRRYGENASFDVRVSTPDNAPLWLVKVRYNTKTGKCYCSYVPKAPGKEHIRLSGKNGRGCNRFPEGGCPILTENKKRELASPKRF